MFHAQSSVHRFGGKVEDYIALHDWLVLIWTVRQGKSDLHQAQSGAEGTNTPSDKFCRMMYVGITLFLAHLVLNASGRTFLLEY
jgi:hypothetical protein